MIPRTLLVAAGLLCLFVAHFESQAQEAMPTSLGDGVLQHLADDDLEKAMDLLAEFTPDAGTELSLGAKDDQGLSFAAGAIHRKLAQLSTDEQYDLLSDWSFPKDGPAKVRLVASFVPHVSPPKEFARSIGERPRESSFSVASIGDVKGLFCSGWMLAQAADDIGRLSRLTTELESLAEKKTPGAETLLTLARIAARRGNTDAIKQTLLKRLERLSAQPLDESTDFVLAVAAIGNDELRSVALQILMQLSQTADKRPHRERAFIRIAHAIAMQLNYGTSDPSVLTRNPLKYWVRADTMTSVSSQRGMPNSMWLVHEGHVLHVGGPHHNVLLCRFPIRGAFTFGCEVQSSEDPDVRGGLLYGGLQFEPDRREMQMRICDAGGTNNIDRDCPFLRRDRKNEFDRLAIDVDEQQMHVLVNRQPAWNVASQKQNSPWIGLRSDGRRRPAFRNLSVQGQPTIPKQISLLEADNLNGWQSDFFSETKPSFVKRSNDSELTSDTIQFNWVVKEGEILSAIRAETPGQTQQSLLRYQRPLLSGETIAYEFFYEPGKTQVHPALGRIAYLIEESSIQVRWITDGPIEWTGLREDNALLEPLNRRGPRKPPLKPGWNQLLIAIDDAKATLALNGELVYERPVDESQPKIFGLYRNPTKTAVRVRHVVMTGSWPEQLPDDFVKNPAATID